MKEYGRGLMTEGRCKMSDVRGKMVKKSSLYSRIRHNNLLPKNISGARFIILSSNSRPSNQEYG